MNFSILFQILKKLDQGEYHTEMPGIKTIQQEGAFSSSMRSVLQHNARGSRGTPCAGFLLQLYLVTRPSPAEHVLWRFVFLCRITLADKVLGQIDHLPLLFT